MLNKKNIYKYLPLILSAFIFLIFQLYFFNYGIGFRDEGFLYLAATRILSGEVPFRDFFLTTTPGTYYFLAAFLKIFGNYLIVGRIMYIVLVLFMLVISDKIFSLKRMNRYVYLISLSIFFLGRGAIAFYNIEALVLSLFSYYFLKIGLDKKELNKIFLAGVTVGLVFIFKQSYGFWVGIGFLAIILTRNGLAIKDYLIKYVLGAIIILIPLIFYYLAVQAFSQFYYYTFIFSRIAKAHRTPFIIKSIVSLPILYYGIKYFPKAWIINQITKSWPFLFSTLFLMVALFATKIYAFAEVSRIYYALLVFVPVFILVKIKNISNQAQSIRDLAIFSLVLFLANASSGREIGIVMWMSPILIPLVIETGSYFNNLQERINRNILSATMCIFICMQVMYLSWGSISNLIFQKSNYSYLNLPHSQHIRVLKVENKELQDITKKIRQYDAKKKLLCFPYCPLMNVLTDRLSPSYYNFFYNEAFLPQYQNTVINDIKQKKPIIVVQKKADLEPEAEFEDVRLMKLKTYIVKNYKKSYETKNYQIYQ